MVFDSPAITPPSSGRRSSLRNDPTLHPGPRTSAFQKRISGIKTPIIMTGEIANPLGELARRALENKFSWRVKLDEELLRQYQAYQKPMFLRSLRFFLNVGIMTGVSFNIYSVIAFSDYRRTGMLILSCSIFVTSALILLYSILRPKQYVNRAFKIHLWYLFFFGSCLALMDLYGLSSDPAGYMFCFLMVSDWVSFKWKIMYTTPVPDISYLAAIGALVVTVKRKVPFLNCRLT